MRELGNRSPQRKWAAILIAGGLTIGIILVFFLALSANRENPSLTASSAQKNGFHYGATTLMGASPEQVGQFALEFVRDDLDVFVEPQVVLARAIKEEELPSLGLGCPAPQVTFEVPPETLVILKGEFDIRGEIPEGSAEHMKYVAYIFDMQIAQPLHFMSSHNGAAFRIALNDPTLPTADGPNADSGLFPTDCPTPIPHKLQHAGESAPPVETPSDSGSPTAILPIPTSSVPEPIPTSGQ